MKKPIIVPYLWFNREAVEAAEFYVEQFPDSRIIGRDVVKGTPSGDCDVVSFELGGMPFEAISAGPYFEFNPAVSFIVNFDPSMMPDASSALEALWQALSDGGTVRMPLDTYPFAKRFGWVADRFGVNWQLMLTDPEGDDRPLITPSLMFSDARYGQAEAARQYYATVFEDTQLGTLFKTPEQEAVMYADLRLHNLWMAFTDSAGPHPYTFHQAVSFMVKCETQAQMDALWSQLSAVPEAEQCGWLQDRFGLPWQIVPNCFDAMMYEGCTRQKSELTTAFLKMKKFDIAPLQQVYTESACPRLGIQTEIEAPIDEVWTYWTAPEHIVHWAFATEDWHAPQAENDLSVGGRFLTRMAERNGKNAFDFSGVYTYIKPMSQIIYCLDDGRKVSTVFRPTTEGVVVEQFFEPDSEMPEALQQAGWQAILDNFKRYVESR